MAATGIYWSDVEIDKLIELVRNYNILWKTDHVNYGKRGARDSAFKRVATALGSKGK